MTGGVYLAARCHSPFCAGWDEALAESHDAAQRSCAHRVSAPLRPSGRSGPFRMAHPCCPHIFFHFDSDGMCKISVPTDPRHRKKIAPPLVSVRAFSFHRWRCGRTGRIRSSALFYGEEVSLAARAFTNGFDLFHPKSSHCVASLWSQPCVHAIGTIIRRGDTGRSYWGDHHRRSVENGLCLFSPKSLIAPRDGAWNQRTLSEYEAWSGVNLHWQLVHRETLAQSPPPSAKSAAGKSSMVVGPVVESQFPSRSCLPWTPGRAVPSTSQFGMHSRDCSRLAAAAGEAYDDLQHNGWISPYSTRQPPLASSYGRLLDSVEWGIKYEVVLKPTEINGEQRRAVAASSDRSFVERVPELVGCHIRMSVFLSRERNRMKRVRSGASERASTPTDPAEEPTPSACGNQGEARHQCRTASRPGAAGATGIRREVEVGDHRFLQVIWLIGES
jgi:hypothetical protein